MFTSVPLEPRGWSEASLSAASGFMWGLVAAAIGFPAFGSRVWGGVIVAPFIGITIGALFLPLWNKRRWVQIAAALGSLYAAGALFALGTLIVDLMALPRDVRVLALPIERVLAVAWGLTFGGYAMALWPLAYVNHQLIWGTDEGRAGAWMGSGSTRFAIRVVAAVAWASQMPKVYWALIM